MVPNEELAGTAKPGSRESVSTANKNTIGQL
jgi:hypothetical protein